MPGLSTCNAGHATTLITHHEAPTWANKKPTKRCETVSVGTMENLTQATPLGHATSYQSDGVFSQRVLHKSERDLVKIAAVNRPERPIVAATCNACVEASITETAQTAG